MVNSQNGWPAKANTDTFTRFQAGGRGWWAANDDVAVIFTDLIEWFDANIERVVQPGEEFDDWSYNNRLVRGSTSTVSNHGSATAIDINATQHPRGVSNTFKAADRNAIRAKLREYKDVVRWGGDYKTVRDDMHFEINASKAKTKALANEIRERDMFTAADKAWLSAEISKTVSEALNDKNDRLGQSVSGALKTTYDRVDADNLQKQVSEGIKDALADTNHPLTARLIRLESKLDAAKVSG